MPGKPEVEGGYVLLARKLLSSGIMEKPPLHLKLWVWMLLQASHKDHGNLKRGQVFTNLGKMRRAMSHKVGYRTEVPTEKEVRGAYESLAKGEMIGATKGAHGVLITIRNYDKYQNPEAYEGRDEGRHEGNREGELLTRRDIQEEKITASRDRSRSSSSSKGKEKNPDIRAFLDFWVTAYQEATGTPYHLNGGKDATIVQRLLKTYGLARLEAMARTFLRSEDPFIEKAGRTIGVLSSQANRLAADSATRPAPTIIPSEVFLRGGAHAEPS